MSTTSNRPAARRPWPLVALLAGGLTAATAAMSLTPRAAWAGPEPEVVYGADNRREVFGLRGAKASAANATVGLVGASGITDNRNGTSRLSTTPLSADLNLCPGQRFFSQPTAPFCSGVLVAPDIVATAGHCVSAGSLAGTRFVFGFRLVNATTARTTIPNADIYRGVQLLADQETSSGADFALVRLDRRVSGRAPQRINRGGPPAVGTSIYVIGHPSGLPTKIAAGARVVRANPTFFEANLDTFGGNSGSPVFDARSNTVLGLLVRGAPDYRSRGSCNVVNLLPDSAGTEDSTNTGVFAGFVPQR
jgi:V8-like Glu-specific endopeptidase